ncbi:hypothetical protein [Actinomadura napierensis]|uniref:Uncharacterized protein n=1 Tax=Actinomadura napierensis TaxID=267854 RepID=A0ABP5M976_9ACTN
MTEPGHDFTAAILNAMDTPDAEEFISRVKATVHAELELLDPTAMIEQTPYYNHSFIPDFVLSWDEAAGKSSRQIFLRSSIRSTTAGNDITALAEQRPVLLALRPARAQQRREVETAQEQILRSPNVLITDAAAVSDFSGDRATIDNPLRTLVRTNLVRGGRGVLVTDTARRLSVGTRNLGEHGEGIAEFTQIIGDVFTSDAATRLQRAAELLEMGVSGDLSRLHGDDLEEGPRRAVGGRLSDAELQVLLPYLLTHPEITSDPAYWSHLGSMITLARLESMATDLEGIDLSPLVVPNLPTWPAARSSTVLHVNDEERPPVISPANDPDSSATTNASTPPGERAGMARIETSGDPVSPVTGWHFHSRMISLVVGQWRIHIAANGKRLKGRDSSAPARWDTLVGLLPGLKLITVSLHGLQRRVRISAEEGGNVYDDVRTIRESIDDQFQVPEIELRPQDAEATGKITVSFTRHLVSATDPVPSSELFWLALNLLTLNNPIAPAELLAMRTTLPSGDHQGARTLDEPPA